MPNSTATVTTAPSPIVSAIAGPVTLVIEPHAEPLVLVVTSASTITVTGQSTSRRVEITHNP